MNSQITLSTEFRKLIETRMNQALKGIEVTFNEILEKQKISTSELKEEIDSLQDTFNLLFQKWSLEILYTLLLKKTSGFGGLKKALGVNSRTLSDKLKLLQEHGYINRNVQAGPPLRVEYKLASKGKDTVLLALPLLYYSAST